MAHDGSRNGAVVSHWDERQSSQNGGDGYDVDNSLRLWFRLIQLLRPAFATPSTKGGIPVAQMVFFTAWSGLI